MSSRLAWISASCVLLLARAASALVLLDDDRYSLHSYRSDPLDPAYVEERYTPESFFGPLPEQQSTITIAADGLGFDATASCESYAVEDIYAGPYPLFQRYRSSFAIGFRIEGAGHIDLRGTANVSFDGAGEVTLTDADGTLYRHSPDSLLSPYFSLRRPLAAGEYRFEVYTAASRNQTNASFDFTLHVRDSAGPVAIPFVCDNGVDDDADGATDFPDDSGCESPGAATEDHVPACSNAADDDGDGLADAPDDPGCASALDESELGTARCDNGIDDDEDGALDFPSDADCSSPSADAELTPSSPVLWRVSQGGNGHLYELVYGGDLSWEEARAAAVLRTPPAGYGPGHLVSVSSAAENDFLWQRWVQFELVEAWIGLSARATRGEWRWVDDTPGVWQDPSFFPNPVQTLPYVHWTNACCYDYAVFPTHRGYLPAIDLWSSDFGLKPAYFVEWEPAGLVCDDGVDEDGDGLADFPDDPGCTSAEDPEEEEPTLPCDNGLDDDGDGFTDFRLAFGDPGCPSAIGRPENPPCDDGIDNDADGAIDAADPWCSPAWPYWESAPCGIGTELALVVAPIGWLGGRRRRRSAERG